MPAIPFITLRLSPIAPIQSEGYQRQMTVLATIFRKSSGEQIRLASCGVRQGRCPNFALQPKADLFQRLQLNVLIPPVRAAGCRLNQLMAAGRTDWAAAVGFAAGTSFLSGGRSPKRRHQGRARKKPTARGGLLQVRRQIVP